MRRLCLKLWKDDSGALIPSEFLFMATILIFGIVTGLVTVRDALNRQLTEFANAIGSLCQSFSFSGVINNCGTVATCGSFAGPDICNFQFLANTSAFPCATQAWPWWNNVPSCPTGNCPAGNSPATPNVTLRNCSTFPTGCGVEANICE